MDIPISQALLNEQLSQLYNDTLQELTLSLHGTKYPLPQPGCQSTGRRVDPPQDKMKMEGD